MRVLDEQICARNGIKICCTSSFRVINLRGVDKLEIKQHSCLTNGRNCSSTFTTNEFQWSGIIFINCNCGERAEMKTVGQSPCLVLKQQMYMKREMGCVKAEAE